jgi:hypothetical protein
MKYKSAFHLLILLSLLWAMGYLWMTPTGNIKPGGFEKPIILMIVGSAISVYLLLVNKRWWSVSRAPIQAVNMGLAVLFVGFHILVIIVAAINMVTK